MSTAHKVIAEATATEGITIRIIANAYGWAVTTIHADGAEVWDGRYWNTEARARAAANRLWAHIRSAEAVAA